MATKVIHVSDLSGTEAEERELGQLIIHEHPGYADLPVTLEALPSEVEGKLDDATRYVWVEWIAPGERRGTRKIVGLEDLNLLADPGRVDDAIQDALIAKHRARGRSGPADAPSAPRRGGRSKVNYGLLEHAGEPHRGRITEKEKVLVRENLEPINERLRGDGLREIDPTDPVMKQRYGL